MATLARVSLRRVMDGQANNSLGQDPCAVSRALFATDPPPCNDANVTWPPLKPGTWYGTNGSYNANACLCNTVIYSLSSACGLCQNATFLYWSEWITDCPANETVYQQWPASIPSNTEIPEWAFMELVNGFWDGPQAQANASAVAAGTTQTISQATTASQPAPTTSNAPTPSPSTSLPPSTSNDSKSSNNTGAIAGGVVGGIAAGVIITSLGIFFWRRRSQTPAYEATPWNETGELPRNPPAMPISATHNPSGSVSRLYNLNDPSTLSSSGAPSNSAWAGSGQYTGAPEV
ncbi:hypothetical protein BJ138DRAFT_1167183 [Hygrophoropsis aurantiaca]|uniref:Uncharacterized protein n=1 Tax=Hygrophoropsis aurantiaca TaxID=72124 RepID=A0ACB7ZSC4_9AGAM|nr:hypothetical protein BJ138DRAFT_1167183 [Hygrophoropsis aurantiaca]